MIKLSTTAKRLALELMLADLKVTIGNSPVTDASFLGTKADS